MKTFTEKVLNIVAQIPRGQTMTYIEVARLAGSPNASRAVGSILAKNTKKIFHVIASLGLMDRLAAIMDYAGNQKNSC